MFDVADKVEGSAKGNQLVLQGRAGEASTPASRHTCGRLRTMPSVLSNVVSSTMSPVTRTAALMVADLPPLPDLGGDLGLDRSTGPLF